MSIEVVVELFLALKEARDNYNDNQKATLLIVNRLSCLEGPLLKFKSRELSIAPDSLERLEEALRAVKEFLDEYNASSMWMSCMRAVRSGKYAQDFAHANELIDRAVQSVGISLDISNEERRQQDLDDMKKTMSNLSKHIIADMQSHIATSDEAEKKRCDTILCEVKALSASQESIMQSFLQVVGHDDCELSVEEKDDFVKMHEEVEELITASVDMLAEGIHDLKDDMEEMKKDILTALKEQMTAATIFSGGEQEDNMPQKVKITFVSGDEYKCNFEIGDEYDGYFVDGLRNGEGVNTWANGNEYSGDWLDDEQHGKGVYTWIDGRKYSGDWIEDVQHGKGVYTYANGDEYDGDWVDGEHHGKGVYTWANSNTYEGGFVADKKQGKGVFTWPSGSKYYGDFVDDKRTGKGVYTWIDGRKYDGEFVEDKRTGKGVFTWPNGDKYIGDFVDGKQQGHGVFSWAANGNRYDGEYVDDKQHGKGVWINGDGRKYRSEWRNNTRTGKQRWF